jgi:hypothetical protein
VISVNAHSSGQKSFNVHDCLGALLAPVLKLDSVAQQFGLYRVGDAPAALLHGLEELADEDFEDLLRRDAFHQHFVHLGPDHSELLGGLLRQHIFHDALRKGFVLGDRHVRFGCQGLVLQLDCLQHHDGSSQVAVRQLGYIHSKCLWQFKHFSAADFLQDLNDLLVRRSWYSDLEAP